MIHNKFRYLLTLVALLAISTGAWAQDIATPVISGETEFYDEVTVTITCATSDVDIYYTLDGSDPKDDGPLSTATGYKNAFTLTETTTVKAAAYCGDVWSAIAEVTFTKQTGPKVTWDPATKTGSFTQPGSDVVLTPIYSAATVSHAAGTPEASETAFETLKEAFAAVQDGDVITLDWNVTLTEGLATPSTASDISFTLDFNGFVIDNTGGTNYIVIDNGCELTLTDNTATQMGGLKCQYPIVGSNGGKVIFQGGRYSFNGCSSSEIALEWDGLVSNYGWVMGDGKEFVDLNNGNLDDDGFPVRVDWKAIELTIGAGRFATFYSDQNTTLADGTDANIGLYTINGEGINLANNTVTVTKVNDPIAIAGMPLLVYNGTTEQKTVTLKVTPVAPTAGQMWSSHFKGTAVDKTFDATDMADNDYYVLSGGKAFAPVYGAGTIAAHKCWLQFDHETNGSAPARQLTIVFDETTGVNEVIEVNEVSDDTLYDLNGRKLNAKPTRKGVYIKNGRKVVVK